MQPKPVPRDRITGSARVELGAQLRTAYERGASIRQLAGGIGRSYGSTHLLLAEAGTVFRGRGAQPRERG